MQAWNIKVISTEQLSIAIMFLSASRVHVSISISWHQTEILLLYFTEDAKPGSFLLRDSFSSHGDFVLSLRFDTSDKKPAVEHYKIMKNKYDIYYRFHTSSKTNEIHGRLTLQFAFCHLI